MMRLFGALMAMLCCWLGAQPAPGTDAPLTAFCFSHSGMSTDECYAYSVRTEDGQLLADFELYCRAEITDVPLDDADAEALRALVDDLWTWDGFRGRNTAVLDGESFGLSAEFGDGTRLTASGSNAFPGGYSAGERAIRAYFAELMEKHGVTAGLEDEILTEE